MIGDFERCYRAVESRDTRFDGWFFTAVTSTRIYCRPSCPAITPKRKNVRFFPTAASAQQAGFRACLRCRPDASPGSPEWLGRKDVVSRAVRLVLDGIVDREGVAGLARRLGYSERQLHRLLVAELGTGAVSLARAQRAQTARTLLETTDLPVAQVAFGAGFASVRQFNDTVKAIFARTPSDLRLAATKHHATPSDSGTFEGAAQRISLRLAYRRPFSGGPLLEFLRMRAVAGIEAMDGDGYVRSLRLPHGQGTVRLEPSEGFVSAVFSLTDLRDLTTAVARSRHLLNLDADPVAVDEALRRDRILRPLVDGVPGRRVPGSTDGFETAVRAVLGQQVSLAGARKLGRVLALACGEELGEPQLAVTHTFPSPEAMAELARTDPAAFPMPSSRRLALQSLAESVADGSLVIDPGTDPEELETRLSGIHGIGAWSASYIVMRAVGDPDAFLPTDLGLRRAMASLGLPSDPHAITSIANRWRPWRAYALTHLWSVPVEPTTTTGESAA
jgi:AraC family transcriptional regulator, regulatory protein of adaptative response / DNA-3-methyladenine glycosylase II